VLRWARLSALYFTFIDGGTQKEVAHFHHPTLAGGAPDVAADPFEWWVTVGAVSAPRRSRVGSDERRAVATA